MNLAPDITLDIRAADQADAPGRPSQSVQLALKVAAAVFAVFMVFVVIILFQRGGRLSMSRDRSGVGASSLPPSFLDRGVHATVVPAPTGAERRFLSRPLSRVPQPLPPPMYPEIGAPPPAYFPPLSRCPSYAVAQAHATPPGPGGN